MDYGKVTFWGGAAARVLGTHSIDRYLSRMLFQFRSRSAYTHSIIECPFEKEASAKIRFSQSIEEKTTFITYCTAVFQTTRFLSATVREMLLRILS